MRKYLYVIVPILFVLLAIKLLATDNIDRCSPFGTDSVKNNKYNKGKKFAEEFGPNTFWGRPNKKDDLRRMLDKIQWLSHSYERDVHWRRAGVMAILTGLIATLSMNPTFLFTEVKYFVIITALTFTAIYLTESYYKHHFLYRRMKFVDIHISKLKEELKLPQSNKINLSMLI